MPDSSLLTEQLANEAQVRVIDWYETYRAANGGDPERYVVAAGLYVTEMLRSGFPIGPERYDTGKGQVRGAGRSGLQKILARYGESRIFALEGGRTTRGTLPAAANLASSLNSIVALSQVNGDDLDSIADRLQAWVVQRAIDFFNRERIRVDIDRGASLESIVDGILQEATKSASYKSGPTAQHLVGAKLAIRFAETGIVIENHSANAADVQTGRLGDFQVRDTVFHVTLAPSPAVIEKCVQNLKQGKRVVLLVPKESLEAARQLARLHAVLDRVTIAQSLSAFIGQNIEELGEYSQVGIERQLKLLLEVYNSRVASAEADQSIQIEIPQWLMELKP